MNHTSIGNRSDAAEFSLIADQIVGALPGALGIAIHDISGLPVWVSPGARHAEFEWNPQTVDLVSERSGYESTVEPDCRLYVFFDIGSDDSPQGAISIVADSETTMTFNSAQTKVREILERIRRRDSSGAVPHCTDRHTELETQRAELLLSLDELDLKRPLPRILDDIGRLVSTHFEATGAALYVPGQQIEMNCCGPFQFSRKDLDRLLRSVRRRKRVLVNRKSDNKKPATGIICSPIVDLDDKVAGILVLRGTNTPNNASIRVVRSICARIHSIIQAKEDTSTPLMSWQDMLRRAGAIIEKHPHAAHAMLFLDIDKMHIINDTMGFTAGDMAIRAVSDMLPEFAASDDIVVNMSGDKFALFCPECTEDRALGKANAILDALSRLTVENNGKSTNLSASVGIALYPTPAADPSSALSIAETASRSADANGGNRAVVYQDLDSSLVQRRTDLLQIGSLQSALIADRFVLMAQPIAPLTAAAGGPRFEILIRMLDEENNLVSPARFMSAAERYHLMPALDRWVLNKTIEQLCECDNTLEINLASFAINISAQAIAQNGFAEFVIDRIMSSNLSPDAICIEITESSVIRNIDKAQRFIHLLRKMGCRVALDDFGTGHCSFAYLKDLPVQMIKIDGVFVRDILDNPISRQIVSSIANIAKVMNARTVAEHVENKQVLQRVQELGIDYAQGYEIGKPQPLSSVVSSFDAAAASQLSDFERSVH